MAGNDERPKTSEKFDMSERAEQVRAHFEEMRNIMSVMDEEPDYSSLFNSVQFKELPPEAQAEIRKEYTEARTAGEDAPEFLALSEGEQEILRKEFGGDKPGGSVGIAEHPTPAVETKEPRESRPKKRKFLAYHIYFDQEGGQAHLTEDYQDWDRRRQDYRKRKDVPTAIDISKSLVSKLSADPSLQKMFTSYCGDIREELDERGVKLFFDPSRTEGGDVVPKWKFFLDSKPVEHYLTLDDLPHGIRTMVREDREYFKRPEYKKWFGKAMQRKREEVISRLAAEHFSVMEEPSEDIEDDEKAESTPPGSEQKASPDTHKQEQAEAEPAPEPIHSDVMRHAHDLTRLLREQFAGLATREGDREEIERHVQGAVVKLLAERYTKDGFDITTDTIRDILHGKMTEEADSEYDAAHAVFTEHLASSFGSSRNDDERGRAALELIRNARSGDPAVDAPSQRVLDDIVAGKFGDDGKQALEKAEFIDAHASLPLERAEPVGKGVRLTLDAKYPLLQAVEDAVKDAVLTLAGADRSDHHDLIVSKLGAKLARLVEAKPNNRLLIYDKKDGHLKVKDLGRFSREMQAMYRKLTEDED